MGNHIPSDPRYELILSVHYFVVIFEPSVLLCRSGQKNSTATNFISSVLLLRQRVHVLTYTSQLKNNIFLLLQRI